MYGKDGRIKQRRGKDIRRPDGVDPPCHDCPKKSPERAHEFELSDKNYRTLKLYWQAQATAGASLSAVEKRDSVLMQNLAVVHRTVQAIRDSTRTTDLAHAVTMAVYGKR